MPRINVVVHHHHVICLSYHWSHLAQNVAPWTHLCCCDICFDLDLVSCPNSAWRCISFLVCRRRSGAPNVTWTIALDPLPEFLFWTLLIAGGIQRLADVFVLLFLSLCLLGNSAPDSMAGQFARYIKLFLPPGFLSTDDVTPRCAIASLLYAWKNYTSASQGQRNWYL